MENEKPPVSPPSHMAVPPPEPPEPPKRPETMEDTARGRLYLQRFKPDHW